MYFLEECDHYHPCPREVGEAQHAAEGTTLDFPTQSVNIECTGHLISALNNSVLLHATAEGGKSLKCVWRSEEGKEASSPSHISGYTSFLPRPS